MTSLSPVRRAVLVLTTSASIVLTGTVLAAQTETPHSAFSVTAIPQLQRQVRPGDFNRDGRTDLVGSVGLGSSEDRPTDLLVSIARSDRSFPVPRSLGIAADAIAVSDLNRDGFQDLVIRTVTSIAVMPGNGDGTFRAPRMVQPAFTSGPYPTIAIVSDFTGDGHRDIATPSAVDGVAVMRVLPGRGDFSFGTPIDTVLEEGSVSAIAGDFNGDSRPDLAVVPLCCSLYVLINNGGLGFSVSQVPLPGDLADITTGDLDGDRDLDLIVTLYFPMSSMPGEVGVLLGNGSGTFAPPTWFEAGVKGEYAVVVGDFTGDGVLDVATGNQSAFSMDDQGTQMSDSVSVLAGDGEGALGPAVSFRITNAHDDGRYQHTLHLLNTNDINRDGVPDLIASPGVVFLSRPPVANRPPHVFAGPDRTVGPEDGLVLEGTGSDPDGHWVDYRWTNAEGRVIARHPIVFFGGFHDLGIWTYTLTVTDSLGAVAVDSVTIHVRGFGSGASLNVPGFGESIPLDEPYLLRFGASAVFTRIDLSYSPDGGETFTPIVECTGLAAGAGQRSCGPAAGRDRSWGRSLHQPVVTVPARGAAAGGRAACRLAQRRRGRRRCRRHRTLRCRHVHGTRFRRGRLGHD
jgi:hypothetical protein